MKSSRQNPDIFGSSDLNTLSVSGIDEQPSYYVSLGEMEDTQSVQDEQPKRSTLPITIAIILVLGVLGIQCFRLQVLFASQNRAKAEGNSVRIITQESDRGLILDKNGVVLAQNDLKVALTINPQDLPSKKADRQALYATIRQHITFTDEQVNFIENNRANLGEPFAVQTNLTKDESLLYTEWFHDLPGVHVTEIPTRKYAELSSLGQLIGYVGVPSEADISKGSLTHQEVGKGGIEQSYNSQLSGIPGKIHAEVNAQGSIVRYISDNLSIQPKSGQTLTLSLDSNLQKVVANALQEAITQRTKAFGDVTKNLGAAAVIMDPNTGAILSMVSLPDYSANLFAGGISQSDYSQLLNNQAHPLLNRTIQGTYPSGSSVKPIIAATALQDGVIDPNRVLDTSTAIKIGQSTFPDWKFHPTSDIRQAIAGSNDIYFYAIGGGLASQNVKGLGIDNLNMGLNAFGLGSPTGVDLPAESSGLTPGPVWKLQTQKEPWYIGDTYHQSIGQGYLLVTPLQMAAATSAIANGGTLYQPQLGLSVTDPSTGKVTDLPHKVLNANWISPANLKAVQQGMELTTQPGFTAQLLGKFGVTTAGKTGTAQFGSNGLTHSWYVGYAPVDHPQYAYAILIEGDGNVTEATEGSEPVAEEILRYLFNKPLQPGQPLDSQALIPGQNQ